MILPICVAVVLVISAVVGGILIINNVYNFGDKGSGGNGTTSNVGLGNPQLPSTPTEQVHVHAFNTDVKYEVIGPDVYVHYKCSGCDERSEFEQVKDAVIATPETLQDILDAEPNGKTIVLSSGLYQCIELRPTLANVQKISVDESGGTNFGEPIFIRTESNFREIQTLVEDVKEYNYLYEASFKDITIVGTQGVQFRNRFIIRSGEVNYHNLVSEDPIRGIDYNAEGWKHTNKLTIKNIKFLNIEFHGYGGTLEVSHNEYEHSSFDGITIENCKFYGMFEDRISGMPAIKIMNAKNVKIERNAIVGHFQGVYTNCVFNLECNNNEIREINSSAIIIQSVGYDKYFTGNINIKSNKIAYVYGKQNYVGDRAIYIHIGNHSTIVIEDNTFTRAVNLESELLEVFAIQNSRFSFINNNYSAESSETGKALDNIVNSTEASLSIVVP